MTPENKDESTNFKEISNSDELISYLSSKKRLDNSKEVYHYTSLYSIISIINNGYWIMRSPRKMNDRFEYQNWDENDWKNVFFTSFMYEQKENIGMWSLYGQPWKYGVKVAINVKAFKKWIKETKIVYKANPNNFKVDENTTYLIGENAKIKHTAVAYSNFESHDITSNETLTIGGAKNESLKEATGVSKLAGYIKNDAWDYEKEIRLRIDLDLSIDCEAVAIKITEELINNIKIVKGPRFKEDINKNIEIESIDFKRV